MSETILLSRHKRTLEKSSPAVRGALPVVDVFDPRNLHPLLAFLLQGSRKHKYFLAQLSRKGSLFLAPPVEEEEEEVGKRGESSNEASRPAAALQGNRCDDWYRLLKER